MATFVRHPPPAAQHGRAPNRVVLHHRPGGSVGSRGRRELVLARLDAAIPGGKRASASRRRCSGWVRTPPSWRSRSPAPDRSWPQPTDGSFWNRGLRSFVDAEELNQLNQTGRERVHRFGTRPPSADGPRRCRPRLPVSHPRTPRHVHRRLERRLHRARGPPLVSSVSPHRGRHCAMLITNLVVSGSARRSVPGPEFAGASSGPGQAEGICAGGTRA
jgi:hypothetical protein